MKMIWPVALIQEHMNQNGQKPRIPNADARTETLLLHCYCFILALKVSLSQSWLQQDQHVECKRCNQWCLTMKNDMAGIFDSRSHESEWPETENLQCPMLGSKHSCCLIPLLLMHSQCICNIKCWKKVR